MKNKFCSIGENEKCQISELIRKAIGLRKKSDFAQLIGNKNDREYTNCN